jgi:hypothetical protein
MGSDGVSVAFQMILEEMDAIVADVNARGGAVLP